MKLFLDIETIPSQDPALRDRLAAEIAPPANMSKPETIAKWAEEKKPALVEAALAKTSFDGALGSICAIGWAFDDDPASVIAVEDYTSLASEANLLRRFFEVIEARLSATGRHGHLTIVGHNVADFDLRFIFRRAVIHGIRPPATLPFRAKPWDPMIFDTMVAWCGTKDRVSLDKLCSVLGIANKGEELGGEDIDGSKVWEFVRAGRIAEVAIYCAGDVERAREVYKRFNFTESVGATPSPVAFIDEVANEQARPCTIETILEALKERGFPLSEVLFEIETAPSEAWADAIVKAAHPVLAPEDYAQVVGEFNSRFAVTVG